MGKDRKWFMKQLKQPITQGQIGLGRGERENVYGLARRQIQGGTKTAMEQMRTSMGGRGFRAGESGIADTAMGTIASEGAERLGKFASEQAASEAMRRSEEKMGIAGLNVQRATGAGQIGASYAQAGAARASARYGAETAANRLDWEREKFKEYEMPYAQEQDAWKRMMDLYGSQTRGQDEAWGRYGSYL